MPHAVHVKSITPHLRCEVLYQSTPSFANEDLSAMIRLRHLSPAVPKPEEQAHEQEQPKAEPEINGETNNEENGGWGLGRKLSVSLSNSARSFFLEESAATTSTTKLTPEDQKPIELLSGYVQLSGWFQYDTSIISDEQLKEFKQKTNISGKFGGLEGMQISKAASENSVYGFISRGVSDIFNMKVNDMNAKFGGIENSEQDRKSREKVPFFSSTQNLLFGSIVVNPGDLKQFLFNSKLPRFLPSSFEGAGVSIRYELIVGLFMDSGNQGPQTKVLKFPLKVNSVFDADGYQPVSKIDQFYLHQTEPQVNEIQGQRERRRSSLVSFRKMFLNGDELTSEYKKAEILKKVKDLASADVEDGLNHDFINDIEGLLELDSRQSITRLMDKLQSAPTATTELKDEDKLPTKIIDGIKFEPQLKTLTAAPQRKYQLSHNSQPLLTLTLNKPVYKISETIKLTLQFTSETQKPLGAIISLDSLELINDEYSADAATTSRNPPRTTHFKRNISLIQSSSPLILELPISSTATHQFKTNIFEHKWCLSLRMTFRDISKTDGDEETKLERTVFEDETGRFDAAKESVTGWVYEGAKVPLIVLPFDGEDSGLSGI